MEFGFNFGLKKTRMTGGTPQSSVYLNFDYNTLYPVPPTGITFNNFVGDTVNTDIVTVHSLVDEDNVAVLETYQSTYAPDGTWFESDTTGDNSGFLPDTTMHGFIYDNAPTQYYEMQFANLNANYKYNILVWGIESLAIDRDERTKYTIGAESQEVQTNPNMTGWSKLDGATFSNLVPNVNGEILLIIEKGSVGTGGALVGGIKLERTET